MNTQEAYVKALELHESGMNNRQVSRALAKEGYLSFRTGKAITPGGINKILHQAKKGYIPMNKTAKAKRMAIALTPTRTHVASGITTIWDVARFIDGSDALSTDTKKAILDLIVKEALSR